MKQAFNYCCIVSKDTGEITVEQKKNQQCIVAESYRNHQIGYESNQGLSKLGAIQKRVYADLRKGIGFEIDKDVGSIKMAEKRARTTKCCPSLISAINRFGVYAAP